MGIEGEITKNDGGSGMSLESFAKESNKIEGIISQEANHLMIARLKDLLGEDFLTPDAIIFFAGVIGGKLRDRIGMDVRVGSHTPPAGGKAMYAELGMIINDANDRANPHSIHQRFESLHPFTDGNGRTGRAIWLWQMIKQQGYQNIELDFLHQFYYQTLSNYKGTEIEGER